MRESQAGGAGGAWRPRELLAQHAEQPAPRRILGAASGPGVPGGAPDGPVVVAPVALRRNVNTQRLGGRGVAHHPDGRLAALPDRSGG